MSNPWLTAIKSIPWGNVIEHAPKVLDKARNFVSSKVNEASTGINEHRASNAPSEPMEKMSEDELQSQLSLALTQIKAMQQQLNEHTKNFHQLSEDYNSIKTQAHLLKSQIRLIKVFISLLILSMGINFTFLYFKFF
jgi:chromosome segregation ATPase